MTKPGHVVVSFTPFANIKVHGNGNLAKQAVITLNGVGARKKAFYIRRPADLEQLTRAMLCELWQTLSGAVRPIPPGTSIEDILFKTWLQAQPYCTPEGYLTGSGRDPSTVREDDPQMANTKQLVRDRNNAAVAAKAAPAPAAPAKKAVAKPAPAVEVEAAEPAVKAPRVRAAIDIHPQAEAKEVKETSLLAWLITKMARKTGVSEAEIQEEIDARQMSNPPRTWVQSDLCRNIGYGAEERNGRYFLRLPAGMDAPHEHKKVVGKPAKAE